MPSFISLSRSDLSISPSFGPYRGWTIELSETQLVNTLRHKNT
jgi:hypothetical protein